MDGTQLNKNDRHLFKRCGAGRTQFREANLVDFASKSKGFGANYVSQYWRFWASVSNIRSQSQILTLREHPVIVSVMRVRSLAEDANLVGDIESKLGADWTKISPEEFNQRLMNIKFAQTAAPPEKIESLKKAFQAIYNRKNRLSFRDRLILSRGRLRRIGENAEAYGKVITR